MQRDDVEAEKGEEGLETANAIDRREEYDGPTRVAEEEVVEVNVLRARARQRDVERD